MNTLKLLAWTLKAVKRKKNRKKENKYSLTSQKFINFAVSKAGCGARLNEAIRAGSWIACPDMECTGWLQVRPSRNS